MNSNTESIKKNYNNLMSKRRVGSAKGNVWKSRRRNTSI